LGYWVGIYAKNTPYKIQALQSAKNLDRLQYVIKDHWKRGYKLIDIKKGGNRWIALFAKGTKLTDQFYRVKTGWSKTRRTIKKGWSDEYDLLSLEYGLGQWVSLFSKKSGYKNQALVVRDSLDDFIKEQEKKNKRGFFLIDIANGW
jgi:hypothetical protein